MKKLILFLKFRYSMAWGFCGECGMGQKFVVYYAHTNERRFPYEFEKVFGRVMLILISSL